MWILLFKYYNIANVYSKLLPTFNFKVQHICCLYLKISAAFPPSRWSGSPRAPPATSWCRRGRWPTGQSGDDSADDWFMEMIWGRAPCSLYPWQTSSWPGRWAAWGCTRRWRRWWRSCRWGGWWPRWSGSRSCPPRPPATPRWWRGRRWWWRRAPWTRRRKQQIEQACAWSGEKWNVYLEVVTCWSMDIQGCSKPRNATGRTEKKLNRINRADEACLTRLLNSVSE